MKVRVLDRFVAKGRVIRYPGEIIDISREMAGRLVERGIVEPLEDEEPGWFRKPVKEREPCGGCPKRSR